ncbi:NAD(P)-binding domain-containing protein [Herbaspirillum lusitanum]|uniref:NAD(P)-binding domain-containing protein n=1 Tax=Herbaspirillum lusitanum TaxID=213312 RepID=A0ABW9A698_9BURK
MKVTVLGYGNVGSAMIKQLGKAGHQVTVTGRDMDKAATVAHQFGAGAKAPAEAAGDAEAILVAVPYGDAVTALKSLGDLNGKLIIDVTNPLTADYMGITVGFSSSAAEEIAKALPGAKVVKAFNTLFAQVMAEGGDFGGSKASAFFAGDDAQAKSAVQALIESIGFAPVDAGGLKNARYLEPLAGLNIYLGYGAGLGTQIAPTWLKR